ncbi:heme anaerobic degradation radical SAM methyltransferase ChuW/HutW [Sodalis sp. RH16]|uniref:heme anaerobic degradation radical SAM methyltransferase ChuW/HutW n=1 Tax=Sodalis sp. RH16 TaxID=3394331 RepID=UPI0039B64AF1
MSMDLTPFFAREGQQPFDNRVMAMPWRNQRPLDGDSISQGWRQLQQRTLPARKRLLYIHIPFCATHCSFCGFYQNPLKSDSTAVYTECLLSELQLEADSPLHQSAPIHGVYLGGGTPTALTAAELNRVIRRIRHSLPLAPDCEITVEGRVLNVDDERLDACLDAGVNRFSIGIQTFDTRIRRRMGRISDGETAIAFLERLCRRDRAAVVCDLLFGLPGQTLSGWRDDLKIISELPLDGVDLYALNVLAGTPLYKAVENGRTTLPDVTERLAFYRAGADVLAGQGWHQLSNSHWAKTSRERNLYNLLIKQGADYLALGSGAGGSLDGQAYMLERNLERYYQRVRLGEKPIAMMTAPHAPEPWQHQLQGGIETGRVALSALTDHSGALRPLLSQWQRAGLIVDDSSCMRLTVDGRFWANNLLQALRLLIPRLAAEADR